jgi:hypothetical protein
MKSTVKRLAAVLAVGTMAIVAPVASANAATTPVTSAAFASPFNQWGGTGLDWGGLPGFTPAPIPWVPTGGVAVVGPVIITTAPTSFINTNNQVSAGGNVTGGQVAAL